PIAVELGSLKNRHGARLERGTRNAPGPSSERSRSPSSPGIPAMNFSLSSVPVGLLAFLAVGCASYPNKKVESAETNLTSEQAKAKGDQSELDRKQADERAQKQDLGGPKQAELDRKQQTAQAETKAGSSTNVSDA